MAANDREAVGDLQCALPDLAADVMSPVSETEVVTSRRNELVVGSLTSPHPFGAFKEVTLLSALFEETLLYHHWRACGVAFRRHEPIEASISRNMHVDQGPRLRIGHVLHSADSASKRTVQRDVSTGRPNGDGQSVQLSEQVIARAIAEADRKFPTRPPKVLTAAPSRDPESETGKDYLLQLNPALGFESRPNQLPDRARHIGGDVRGLDNLGHFQHLAAFAVMNPEPAQELWLSAHLGLDRGRIRRAFRIHSVYQAVGRLLRDPDCPHNKTVLTLARDDAEFIWQVFEGASWIGKVGNLESFTQKAPSKAPGRPRMPDDAETRRLRARRDTLARKQRRGSASPEELQELEAIRNQLADH